MESYRNISVHCDNNNNIRHVKFNKYGVCNLLVEMELSVGKDCVYFCKETAMLDLNTKQVMCTTFKPPKNTNWDNLCQASKVRNIYLMETVHGLPFSEGENEYSEFHKILRKICAPYIDGIFTKGTEKAKMLSDILGKRVFNLEDIPGLYSRSDLELVNVERNSAKRYACFNGHNSSSGRIHCCLNKVYRHKSKLRKFYKC